MENQNALITQFPTLWLPGILTGYLGFRLTAFALTLLICLFLRAPDRHPIVPDHNCLMSPADGVILEAKLVCKDTFRICIFLSIFDVHVQYAPTKATVVRQTYSKGKFNLAYILTKSHCNERMVTEFRDVNGNEIIVVQLAGQVARRIHTFVKKGDSVNQGDQFGVICFGSRVDLLFSTKAYTSIGNVGQIVRAGRTILARRTA